MDAFKSVSDTLAKIFKGREKTDPVDKNDILNLIDNNMIVLKLIVSTYDENPEVIKFIKTELIPASGSNKDNESLREIYVAYVRELSTVARRLEEVSVLKSLRDAANLVLMDHEKIRDQFTSLFNDGTDVSDIKLDQIKLSHATLFGFINLTSLMTDWFCYFYTSLAGQKDEETRLPAYREQTIKASSKTVADFVSDVLLRGVRRGILDVVKNVKTTGDVAIYTEAATLDSYANINDYPGLSRFISGFNVFQPILLVREFFTKMAHDKYKRNLMLRDWMITKTAVLRMDLAKVDPESPEYQRQLKILNRYSDEIAKLDKKIAAYEQS